MGYRAPRRPGGHAQLHWRPVQRELLGHGGARDRRPLSRQTSTPRRWPTFPNVDGVVALDPRRRLRHGQRGRRPAGAAPHPGRLRHARQLLRPCWWWAWAARPTRSSACWRRAACAKATSSRPSASRTPAAPPRRVARGVEVDQRHAARGQRGRSASPCRASAPHRRPAVRRLGRLLAASAPTRRWARRWTCWCAHGGTAILSETPEIYGGEHLLTRRAVSRERGRQARCERIQWWNDYTARNDGEMNNNPSPGNKAGGLTTILEKSLGAVAKGGTTQPGQAVYEYAATRHAPRASSTWTHRATTRVSATGQVAGGANLICFTTGRGSAYGCAPAPSLKLSHQQPACGNARKTTWTSIAEHRRWHACGLPTRAGRSSSLCWQRLPAP